MLQSLLAQSTRSTIQWIAISPNSNIPNGEREKERSLNTYIHLMSYTS